MPADVPSSVAVFVPVGKGKGSSHASQCAGPFVAALDRMPPEPPTGAKRVAAGLADVLITTEERHAIRKERAARALVALLPRGSASFVLDTPAADVESRPASAVAEDMVYVLADRGVSSLDAAASAMGRVMAFVMTEYPDAVSVNGVHLRRFFETNPMTKRLRSGIRWLRDWCGVDFPARGAVMNTAPRQSAAVPPKVQDTLEMDLKITFSLEYISTSHPSAFVRGHAAGWNFLGRYMLRFEQSSNMCINALVPYSAFGVDVTITSCSARLDKNPNASAQRPRPVWGTIDGIHDRDAIRGPLLAMLAGREALRCILVDTDSPNGDPSHPATTRWLLDPLKAPARVDQSLHALLRMPPLNLTETEAARYHGHFGKRFNACIADASPDFSDAHRNDLGRFAGSSAQSDSLEPVAAMLERHTVAVTAMPNIYSRGAAVQYHLDLAVRLYAVLRHAYSRALADCSLLNRCWSKFDGPFSEPAPALASPARAPALALAAPPLALMPPGAADEPAIVEVAAPGAAPTA